PSILTSRLKDFGGRGVSASDSGGTFCGPGGLETTLGASASTAVLSKAGDPSSRTLTSSAKAAAIGKVVAHTTPATRISLDITRNLLIAPMLDAALFIACAARTKPERTIATNQVPATLGHCPAGKLNCPPGAWMEPPYPL